jgi:hypothetical protein
MGEINFGITAVQTNYKQLIDFRFPSTSIFFVVLGVKCKFFGAQLIT